MNLIPLVLIALAALTSCALGGSRERAHAETKQVSIRGSYGKDSSSTGYERIAQTGFNTVDAPADRAALDELQQRGLKGLVWLGTWLKNDCVFERDDDWIRSHVAELRGHPAVAAYYLADEPLVSRCPEAPAAVKGRSDLVKSIDPSHPTFIVVQVTDGSEDFPYRHWTEAADILGLDVYPCHWAAAACDYSRIDSAIRAADDAGVARYWAIIQDFQDDYYRLPTPDELRQQLEHWGRSRMSGYLVFSWNYRGLSLEAFPDNLQQLGQINAAMTSKRA